MIWNEAVEFIEATEVIEAVEVNEAVKVIEAVEVIEAAEVKGAREITQYDKCMLSFSLKGHKRAKNIEKKIWKHLYIRYIQTPFCKKNFEPFLLEAVEAMDVTFNQIQGS